jgi:RNA polymerase sigma-70 factor, ECF subfamily
LELFLVDGVQSSRVDVATLDEKRLIGLCRQGDETAFEELVRRHQQHALNIAYGLLHNYEDACEVAQDTFVRVHHAIGQVRGEAEFTTWMYRIVINLARNYVRHGHRRAQGRHVSLDEPVDKDGVALSRTVRDPADAADASIVKEEFAQLVMGNINQLSRKYREVLVLRYAEQLSYEEIAKVVRRSVGTVKSRISRAREELRRKMEFELK